MAEDIVEDVRLLQIVELVGLSDELARGEAAVGQVVEEHLVRDQARHRHHAPAGEPGQLDVDPREIRDARAVQVQRLQAFQERVAGPAFEQGRLALIEGHPDLVLGRRIGLPALVDGPVGPRPGGGPLVKPSALMDGTMARFPRSSVLRWPPDRDTAGGSSRDGGPGA